MSNKTARHCEEDSKVLMAMESTGCYHINLFSFLSSQGIRTLVVNPLLISNCAKLSLRKTKTDKKDAMTIAKFLLDHHKEISQLSISQDNQDLRDLSRERESLSHLISATKVEIKRVLRTTFPELETIGDIDTGVMLRLIKEYPSARSFGRGIRAVYWGKQAFDTRQPAFAEGHLSDDHFCGELEHLVQGLLPKAQGRRHGTSESVVCHGPQTNSRNLCHAFAEDLFQSQAG